MTGVKGRSGGPRKNAGGVRAGAGRKPKPAAKETVTPEAPGLTRDPLEFLLDVMQGRVEANAGQIRAATAAAQYVHAKRGEGGKKDAAGDRAKSAAGGKFAPAAPPKLVAAGGKVV